MDTLHEDPHTFLHAHQAQLTKYLLLAKMLTLHRQIKHTFYTE